MRSVAAALLSYHKRQPYNFKGRPRPNNGIVAAEDVQGLIARPGGPRTDVRLMAADTGSASKPGKVKRSACYGILPFKS